MTLQVRDEVDILEANLRYHLAQGVDFVIALDNGSQDGSLEILQRYADAGLLHLVRKHDADQRRQQGTWQTELARLALAEFEADWVINNDADEFWWPVAGDFRGAFASIPKQYTSLAAPRPEFLPSREQDGDFLERLVIREARSRSLHKMAQRGIPDIKVGRGSHRLFRESSREGSPRRPGRPIFRPVLEEAYDDDLLIPAPRWPIRILHFPLRSFEQFETRVRKALYQEGPLLTGKRADARREMHDAYEAGRLPELYARMALDDEGIEAGLRVGKLVRDTSLRDFMASCPDPLARPVEGRRDADRAGTASRPAADGERELARNAEDMMLAWTRSEHALAADRGNYRRQARRARRELEQVKRKKRRLERKNTELRRRLAAARRSRPGRVRDRAARLLRRARG